MAYDGLFFRGLTQALAQHLVGGKIDKVHQPEKDELSLGIRAGSQNYKLKVSADASLPHVTLSDEKKENPLQAPMFCMLLRKHLSGGRITSIHQVGLERIIEIEVESRDELGDLSTKVLAIEIMGKHSNIILYQKEDQKILESIKRISSAMSRARQIYPGIPYQYPPFSKSNLLEESPRLEHLEEETLLLSKYLVGHWQGFSPSSVKWLLYGSDLPIESPLNQWLSSERNQLIQLLEALKMRLISGTYQYAILYDASQLPIELLMDMPSGLEQEFLLRPFSDVFSAVNAFFSTRDQSNRLDQKGAHMRKMVSSRLEKSQGKLSKLEEDLQNAEHAESYKILGDLILSNLYQIEKGMNEVTVDNYYDEAYGKLTIELDIRLSPSENAQRYFKRYNKAKNGQYEILRQMEETSFEVAYLEQVLTAIDISTDSENLDDIRTELAQQGYMKRKPTYGKEKKSQNKPLHYTSSEGYDILVGKNNLQNDQLTLKLASNKDIWLHTKIIPGSHVIIRSGGNEVPEQTIYEAALIAAFHSKARQSGQVPVDYTLVKNVSKPSGAKPGMVIYSTNKTLYVTPDETLIKKLSK